MNTRVNKIVVTSALVLSLSGCLESLGIKDDGTQTKVEGAGIGALLGAGLGAALGGRDGAAIGALAGGGLGFLLGNEVAKRKEQYATQEDLIAGESQHTAEILQSTRSVNSTLQSDIRDYKRQVSSLSAQIRKDSSKKSALQAHKSTVDKRHAEAVKALHSVDAELQTAESLYSDASKNADKSSKGDLNNWNKRIKALKAEKVKLEKNTKQLQAVSNTIAL